MVLRQESISMDGMKFPEQFPRKLSTVQKKILLIILENQEKDGQIEGLTSYELRKLGIPGRTFDINRYFLLDNQLIEKINEKKAGKQIRKYYSITTIGVFSLFCSLDGSEIDRLIPRLSRYIPKLSTNWNKLKGIFGNMLVEIFSQSIYRVSLDYFNIGLNENRRRTVLGFWLITSFPTKDHSIDLIIRKRLVLSRSEFANKGIAETFANINELGIRLLNTVIFTFYYILMNPITYEDYIMELRRHFLMNYIRSHKGDNIDEEQHASKKYGEKLDSIRKKGVVELNRIIENDIELKTLYHRIKNEISKKITTIMTDLNY